MQNEFNFLIYRSAEGNVAVNYNLDAIISVGYRVNSRRAKQFLPDISHRLGKKLP